ncbi:hypothetical protein JDV02_008957 [Purpureocillium takamizusanense]|uniref:alpha-L-fucosidase n=1 Tax=Purpureocillium takamizusanense TaxID=2060973 RepID=A0A9Q8VFP4_9HYPO|nr:uncharacterized protein JDV02_008957 [Purpureocillium takamizusanense]UNI23119.1 hypothetical protein JDV02_008957 [Purpureocillium takamizusanense]
MLLLVSLAALAAAVSVRDAAAYKPKFRISPMDGSKIALPTREQLAWQDKEIGVLIHYEIATYLDIDGCNNVPDLVPAVSLFDPTLLNTDQWMDSIVALGAKYATLVAKHNCGFATWPSKVRFPTRGGGGGGGHHDRAAGYNYTIADSPVHGTDLVGRFVKSAKRYGVGHGFYYSVVVNNFLNVQNSAVRNTELAPGQVGITNETYNQIVFDQLTELWTKYGTLTEIWFDGGYSSAQMGKIEDLLQKHQSQAVIFNGCQENGTCVSANSVRWIGTEMGQAPEENWSTGLTNDGGDSGSPFFCPAECDTTLQTQDRWFWGVNQPLRPIKEMIDVYHKTVGRNCVLELDLAPDRSGLIPANQAARYKQLGDFIASCYGKPVAAKRSRPVDGGAYSVEFARPTAIDRVSLMEDQTDGQVIRSYQVHARIVDADGEGGGGENQPWTLVSNGTSVGHKKIDIFAKPVTVTELRVSSTFVDTPKWRAVTAHLCDELTAKMVAAAE